MPIRRKDGSIFKLTGPNKIMVTQELWDNEEFLIIHNFNELTKVTLEGTDTDKPVITLPEPVVLESGPSIDMPVPMEAVVQIEKQVEPEVEILTTPEPEPIIEPKPPPVKAETTNQPRSPYRALDITEIFCLPATVSQHTDDLYGDEVIRVNYQDPFKLQATIVTNSDVRIIFWTTVKKVTVKSVLFHRVHRRWWRVQEIQDDATGDGIVLICIPSDLKPDFTQS